MNELKQSRTSIWMAIALIISALTISAASVYSIQQYNKTQLDIANIQKDAQISSSENIKNGLGEIGSGVCKTSTKSVMFC